MGNYADDLVNKLTIGAIVTWTPQSLGLNPVSFNDCAQRVLELAIDGKVEAIETHRESQSGERRWDFIRFKRLK